jgi:hypothetical protein
MIDMPKRKRGNTLEKWEVALIKAMLKKGGYNDQDILAYFTRPTRSVNHRAIGEIRNETKHKSVKPSTEPELDEFLSTWPDIDPQTGLSVRGDELLIKAREAMIGAVHTFNSAGLTFRAEMFICTAVIAWTYLLHAWYRREGVDYRYKLKGAVQTTKQGADKYWELGFCLRHAKCPIEPGAVKNLEFLMDLRHEIEHRSTDRIDDAIGAKLQACCINFNDAIKKLFGLQFGLERRLPIALQFVTFASDQRAVLKKANGLPPHVETMMTTFHDGMSEEQQKDPAFAYRVAFVPKLGSRASNADIAIEFVKPDSAEGVEISKVLLKHVDRQRYTSTHIVEAMRAEGYPRFTKNAHTKLWKDLDAKKPDRNLGKAGLYKGSWEWFDSWFERVRAHCQEQAARYA